MPMMSIHEKMEKEAEHIENFKGSIKGKRIIHRDRIANAQLLYEDYFQPNTKFHDGVFNVAPG